MRAPLGYERLDIDVDGVCSTVAVAGPVEGLPVLFLHGFSNTPRFANRKTMAAIARAQFVADEPVRIIAPILPGFSGTEALGDHPGFDSYAKWVNSCLDEMGVKRPVIIVGESTGGAIAISFAANYPDRVASLALFNSVGAPLPYRTLSSWAVGVMRSAFVRRGHERQWVMSAIDACLLIRHPISNWKLFSEIASSDLTELMHQVRDSDIPVVAVFGKRDAVVPTTASYTFARALGTEPTIIDADHRAFIDGHEAISLVVGELVEAEVEQREPNRSEFAPGLLTEAEEQSLAVQVAGTTVDGAPTVLAIHGFGLSSRTFGPLASEVGKWTQWVAPDLPGYGDSYRPDHVFTVDEHAEELSRFIDREGLTDVVLLGFSLGAQIAVAVAVLRPEVVRGCVLISPTCDPRARTVPLQLARIAWDILGERSQYVIKAAADYLRAGPKTMTVASVYVVTDRIHERLRQMNKPVLVVRGSRDRIVPQDWAEKVADLVDNGWVLNIKGEAHACFWARPQVVSEAIKKHAQLWGRVAD